MGYRRKGLESERGGVPPSVSGDNPGVANHSPAVFPFFFFFHAPAAVVVMGGRNQ